MYVIVSLLTANQLIGNGATDASAQDCPINYRLQQR